MCKKITTEQAFIQIMQSEEGKKLAFQCYYDWNVLDACQRFQISEEWQAVSSYLAKLSFPGKRVLDLGAGNGIASYALANMNFTVTAVEPDPSDLVGYGALLKMIRTTSRRIDPVSAFGERLPFHNKEFSLVYARQVLHHAQDLSAMLREIARVLKPHGIFIAVREHVVGDKQTRDEFLHNHVINQLTGQEGAFRLDEYLHAIKKSGLHIKKVIGPWDSVINHYPCSNYEFKQEIAQYMEKRFGNMGNVIIKMPGFEKLYRSMRTAKDQLPGHMFSFIATA